MNGTCFTHDIYQDKGHQWARSLVHVSVSATADGVQCSAAMQLREKCLCLTAVILVVVVSVASDRPYDDQPEEEQQRNVRDKRTLNFLLKSFADAIGYDVQKRPSVLPFGVQLAPVGVVTIIPPIGPVTPVKAPAMAPASAAGPAAPAMAPAAPAMAPAAPAMAPASPAMAPAKPAMAPPAAMAPAPAAMAPAPAAPAAGKATPAAPAMAPAMPSAGAMPPAGAMAPAPAMPPAAPAAPAVLPAAPAVPPAAPAAPAGKAAPLLTETIRKVFNLNFNWNRNLQPQRTGVAPDASAAPQVPSGVAPAPQVPAGAPAAAPQMPAGAPAAAPQMPAGAPAAVPQMPAGAAPAVAPQAPAPQMPAAPAVPNIVPLAVPAVKDPVPAPMAPAMKDYSLPEAVQLFWQHSPWNQPHLPHVQNAVPEYRQYSTPDGERGYHVRRVQQNAHLQHHDLQPQDNDADDEDNNARERQEDARSSEENDDANGDSSKAYVTINNQPRGFQPAYAESRDQHQNGGFYQPGLPLAVHGVHEDKVLVAWPSPFELAGSEKKLKKVNPHGRISGAASENLEYRYEPENYNQFNFYTIPPPVKNAYGNYEALSEPNLADSLSANARIHEKNYGKKYTTVHVDRQTYHH
ncbi:hypothetical protein CBL_01061 [Carabus blaptoides fortunei]